MFMFPGMSAIRLWEMPSLSGHGQVWWQWSCQAELYPSPLSKYGGERRRRRRHSWWQRDRGERGRPPEGGPGTQVAQVQETEGMEKQQQIDGLMQDCSISSALAMEILQSCAKPSRFNLLTAGCVQVVEILPHESWGPVYAALSILWVLMSWQRKEPGISNHSIDLVGPESPSFWSWSRRADCSTSICWNDQ